MYLCCWWWLVSYFSSSDICTIFLYSLSFFYFDLISKSTVLYFEYLLNCALNYRQANHCWIHRPTEMYREMETLLLHRSESKGKSFQFTCCNDGTKSSVASKLALIDSIVPLSENKNRVVLNWNVQNWLKHSAIGTVYTPLMQSMLSSMLPRKSGVCGIE